MHAGISQQRIQLLDRVPGTHHPHARAVSHNRTDMVLLACMHACRVAQYLSSHSLMILSVCS